MSLSCVGFENCETFYDGCNNCVCRNGMAACTKMMCFRKGPSRCTKCATGYTLSGSSCVWLMSLLFESFNTLMFNFSFLLLFFTFYAINFKFSFLTNKQISALVWRLFIVHPSTALISVCCAYKVIQCTVHRKLDKSHWALGSVGCTQTNPRNYQTMFVSIIIDQAKTK